jgi:hypothetical protein
MRHLSGYMRRNMLLKFELELEGFARLGGAPNLVEGPTKRGPNLNSDFCT